MSKREPANIRRLLRENDQYAAAQKYATDVQRGDAVSAWHEQLSHKSGRPEQRPPQDLQNVDLKVVACSPKERMQRKLAEELFVLNKAALLDRKERMRLHLQQDSLRIQRELAAQGLGVVPTLD